MCSFLLQWSHYLKQLGVKKGTQRESTWYSVHRPNSTTMYCNVMSFLCTKSLSLTSLSLPSFLPLGERGGGWGTDGRKNSLLKCIGEMLLYFVFPLLVFGSFPVEFTAQVFHCKDCGPDHANTHRYYSPITVCLNSFFSPQRGTAKLCALKLWLELVLTKIRLLKTLYCASWHCHHGSGQALVPPPDGAIVC